MKVSNHFLAASAVPLPTRREDLLARLTEPQVWDLLDWALLGRLREKA